jgi:hypothetical protein
VQKKKSKPTKSKLKKKLDEVFSLYIRHKFSINGMCCCYTCGNWGDIKTMQAGHFMSRRYLLTRWEEDNVRIQCRSCNLFNQGEQYEFGKKLEAELGISRVEDLRFLRHTISKYSTKDYETMIEYYTEELKNYEH